MRRAIATSALVALFVVGCAEPSELVPVAGTVLIDGEPLSQGSIQFVPEAGRPAVAKIGPDGAYRLTAGTVSSGSASEGIKRGKYRIAVSASEVIDEQAESVHWYAPSQYAHYETSGLEADITAPDENLVLELTWEGTRHDGGGRTDGGSPPNAAGRSADDKVEDAASESEATESSSPTPAAPPQSEQER